MVVIAAIAVLSLGLLIYSILTAPVGHQDARGFWSEEKPQRPKIASAPAANATALLPQRPQPQGQPAFNKAA